MDDQERLSAARVWIVDPLDGTSEFGENGRTDWAVHVALIEDGAPIAAAVRSRRGSRHDHVPGPRFRSGHRAACVWLSAARTPHRRRSRSPTELDAELVFMGSAGAKTMAVVLGEADAYVHLGGQYEWDSAAPVGVALAAGLGHSSRRLAAPLQPCQSMAA